MKEMKCYAIVLMMFIYIGLPVFGQQNGNNVGVLRRYLPPDIYWPPGKQERLYKLDINNASLEQLMSLPHINEDLALKIMNRRPVKSLQDLARLPYIDMDRMKLILKGISHLVIQPFNEKEEEGSFLKQ